MPQRRYDVVLVGGTGAAGRRAAQHLRRAAGGARIALAGRSAGRLRALRDELGVDWPVVVADARDRAAVDRLAADAVAVASAVGPYARLGMPLVEACADHGTAYCDLTGEVLFMRRSIDLVQRRAADSGARIVHACGYDSVPTDLAVHLLARAAADDGEGVPGTTRVLARGRGGVGGGTIDSARAQVDEAAADPAAARVLADPWALVPQHVPGPLDAGERDRTRAHRDDLFGVWTAPWPLGAANLRVARRSAALTGRDDPAFRVDEGVPTGHGPAGALGAAVVARAGRTLLQGLGSRRARPLLDRVLPSAGSAPSQRVLDGGWFRVDARTTTTTGARYAARISARLDPGYAATGAMLAESALCLALDPLDSPAGVTTPAAAMGDRLVERLRGAGFVLEAHRR